MGKRRHAYDYDLIVLGSGAGGGVAAHLANDMGKKVAIVEPAEIGGECPNWGCVPTKAMLFSAELYEQAKNAEPYGIRAASVGHNWPAIRSWKDLAIKRTGTSEGDRAYEAEGITVFKARGHFLSPHEISIGRRRYTAKNILIATGTSNFIPPVNGLEETGFITYREAINLPRPPKSIAIIGGGAIGCEFAQIFATFGSEVHIVEMAPRLLGKEDSEVGELIKNTFETKYGMSVYTGAKVTKLEKDHTKKLVYVSAGRKNHIVRVDEVMLAAGKVANVDLGLENAGVEYTQRAVKVNDMMQTTAKHIYAAGDVAGPHMFTHMASYQSRIAAHNMFSRNKVVAKYHAVPRCTFLTPEIASVGMTEEEAKVKGLRIRIGLVPISVIGRANTSDTDTGFVKVIATHTGVLIGASIVSPRAGEMIHELALAVNLGLKAEDVAATIHAFPTWSQAIRVACAKVA